MSGHVGFVGGASVAVYDYEDGAYADYSDGDVEDNEVIAGIG